MVVRNEFAKGNFLLEVVFFVEFILSINPLPIQEKGFLFCTPFLPIGVKTRFCRTVHKKYSAEELQK